MILLAIASKKHAQSHVFLAALAAVAVVLTVSSIVACNLSAEA